MAKTIFSFKLNEKGTQFFYIHNTFFELPHTIPMDIVSFISFNRGNFDEFLRVFHYVYPELFVKGTTLKEGNYAILDSDIRQHIEHLAGIIEQDFSNQLLDLSWQICKLFENERTFSTFKKKFNKLFKNISLHLPRPLEYYESWNSTADALFKGELAEKNYLEKLIQAKYDESGNAIVPDFLLELINKNLIPLNSIPHVFRNHAELEQIFKFYGAELLLPQVSVDDIISQDERYFWKEFKMEGPLLRRFTELCLHSDYGIFNNFRTQLNEIKLPIHELDDEQLFELNDLSYNGARLINFSTEQGLHKLPWYYTRMKKSSELCFLAEYHDNALILFDTNNGLELDHEFYQEILRIEGMLFEANISGLYSDNHIWRYNKTSNLVEYVQQSAHISMYSSANPSSFALVDGGDKYFYNSGWFNLKNQPLSPLCFTAAGPFSEGLAPVCLNGKWGYVDEQFNLVIPAIYGHAQPFTGGHARVFLLDKQFLGEKGEWAELPINEDLGGNWHPHKSVNAFLRKYNGYPKSIKLPVRVLFEKLWNETRIELNYFGSNSGDGLDRRFGKYVVIDRSGRIIFKNVDRFTFDLSATGEIIFNQNESIDKDESSLLSGKRKSIKRSRVQIYKQSQKFLGKLHDKKCTVFDIPNELLSDAEFMLEALKREYIDYTDLPLNLKLESKFILMEISLNTDFEHTLPSSVKQNKLKDYKSIIEQQRCKTFVNYLEGFVLIERNWPEHISYFELYTGKSDDMYHYTLKANKPLTASEFILEIGTAMIQLRGMGRLFQDIFFTCENIYQYLVESGLFSKPDLCVFSVIFSSSKASTKYYGSSVGVFNLQITHELYQDQFEHTIFLQANAPGDFTEDCEVFVSNNPPHPGETLYEYSEKIKKYLLEHGYAEEPLLQVPVYKHTILPLLESFEQLRIRPQTQNEEINPMLLDNDEELPF